MCSRPVGRIPLTTRLLFLPSAPVVNPSSSSLFSANSVSLRTSAINSFFSVWHSQSWLCSCTTRFPLTKDNSHATVCIGYFCTHYPSNHPVHRLCLLESALL